jgi:hypothetical protein
MILPHLHRLLGAQVEIVAFGWKYGEQKTAAYWTLYIPPVRKNAYGWGTQVSKCWWKKRYSKAGKGVRPTSQNRDMEHPSVWVGLE